MALIGLVGCGKQAGKHAKALQALGAELVVVDRDLELAASFADQHGALMLDDPDAIFSHPGVRGIDICTPTPSHLPLCLAATEANLPFFVEKPLCGTVDEARRIAHATQAAGVIGTVGYIYRFVPSIETARSLVQSGALGDVLSATLKIGGRGNHQSWKHQRATGGGAISEMMVHMLDLALWIFGPLDDIDVLRREQRVAQRDFGSGPEPVDAEDFVLALARFAEAPEVLIQADFVSGVFRQSIEIHGSSGTVVAAIDPSINPFVHLHSPAGDLDAGRHPLPATGDLYLAELGEFMEVVRGERTSVRSSVADSLSLMEALELVEKGNANA